MNRRMAKAKAARKWHAAKRRQLSRLFKRMASCTVTITVDARELAAAMGNAAAAVRAFGQALRRSRQGFRRHPVNLEPGQLFARAPGGELVHLGTTGPLRLGLDPLPGQRCTCTVERVTKTDSRGQLHQVDVPGPTCDWCQRQPPPPVLPDCGVCGEPIRPDRMTGTTCGCAPGSRGRSWSPMLCECTGTGPTCGYCRGHGVP